MQTRQAPSIEIRYLERKRRQRQRERETEKNSSVAPQHAVDQVAQRAPVVLPAGKVVLVDEEHVLLEAGVEVRLEPELADHGVVVAVDVGVDAVHALEDLAHEGRERLGEGDAWDRSQSRCALIVGIGVGRRTNAAREDRLVVNAALDPAHELLDVGRRGHLGWPLVVFRVLPQVLEPASPPVSPSPGTRSILFPEWTYSSVAFISGHDCGEQNSVMAP